jgi:hypothetical protein
MTPGVAQSLAAAGFTSKAAVGQWLSDNTILPMGEVKKWGWFDFNYSGGTRPMVDVNGKPMLGPDGKQLTMLQVPDDTPFRWAGTTSTILVGNTGSDESIMLFGNMGGTGRGIDPWR